MAIKQAASLVSATLALLCGVLLIAELQSQADIQAYNLAITQARFDDAAKYPGEHGLFAEAYQAQLQGHFQDARVIYGQLKTSDDNRLKNSALFNLGNTYLQQASTIDLDKDSDLGLPLLELAKSSYRDLLKEEPTHWNGKYNLERALLLLPDRQEKALMEIQGRRGAVRTIISRDPEDNLP